MSEQRKWEITHLATSIALKCLGFLIVLFLLFVVLFRWVRYDEIKMEPALKPGDLVLIDKWNKTFHTQDLVAVEYDGKILIRRVVALGGDEVEITEDGLLVNDVLQSEPYTVGDTKLYQDGFSGYATLSADEIFVLADVREDAEDSRAFGPISVDRCLGRVAFFLRRRNF